MYKRPLFFLLLTLYISSLACQTVVGIFNPSVPSEPTLTLSPTRPAVSSTLTLTEPTLTPPRPCPSPTWTGEPRSTASPQQLSIFERLWQIVNDEYLYADFNGADWNAIHAEYRQKIAAGLNPQEYYAFLDEMLNQLGDEHSFYLSPAQVVEQESEFAGENDYVGVGIYTLAVPQRKRIAIIVVFPDSPAEKAGLKSHDSILSADGQPILDENGVRNQLLRGVEGSRVTLTVQTPGEQPREVSLERRHIQGALPAPHLLLHTRSGKNIAYLLLPSFSDDTIDDQVRKGLQELSAQVSLDGIILDNRLNTGGADTVARNTLSYFTSGTLGYFYNRKNEKRWFSVPRVDVGGSSSLPLVTLIGKNTASFGEIFAGILQDSGRATLIGEQTDGNVELLKRYDFEDGSVAWIAHEAFRPKFHPQQNWEQTGIVPDITAISNWDEVTTETDLAVQTALQFFDQQ